MVAFPKVPSALIPMKSQPIKKSNPKFDLRMTGVKFEDALLAALRTPPMLKPARKLATKSKRNLEPYFNEHNKNTGRVKQIASGFVTVNISKSWGVGAIVLELERCIGFSPKFDDRVYLRRNEDGEMFLTKMTKSRQDGAIFSRSPRKRLAAIQEPP
jgi:hypothetical protein